MYRKVSLSVGTELFAAKGAIVVAPQSHSIEEAVSVGNYDRPATVAKSGSVQDLLNGSSISAQASRGPGAADTFTPEVPRRLTSQAAAESEIVAGPRAVILPSHQCQTVAAAKMTGGQNHDSSFDVMLAELERVFTALRRLESRLAGLVSSKPSSIH